MALTSGCASPSDPAEGPHAATIAALRPKLDSIEGRITFQAAALAARIDSLHATGRAPATEMARSPTGDDTVGITASESVRSRAVPGGVIRGIVLDHETGEPIEAAQVHLRNTQIGALSDTSGHFEIQRVPPGQHQLMAERVGYTPVTVGVSVQPPQGVVARFQLRPHEWVECEAIVVRGVWVRVRDVLTGLAPATATAMRVSNERDRWWALGHAEPEDESLTLSVQVGTGPLKVEVAAEGYAPWADRAVPPQSLRCGAAGSASFDVWLLPVEDHSWRKGEGE